MPQSDEAERNNPVIKKESSTKALKYHPFALLRCPSGLDKASSTEGPVCKTVRPKDTVRGLAVGTPQLADEPQPRAG